MVVSGGVRVPVTSGLSRSRMLAHSDWPLGLGGRFGGQC